MQKGSKYVKLAVRAMFEIEIKATLCNFTNNITIAVCAVDNDIMLRTRISLFVSLCFKYSLRIADQYWRSMRVCMLYFKAQEIFRASSVTN